MLTVACVLRSGGDYHPWHVAWLHSQVARHLPRARFVCLSDIPVTCERLPLLYNWPGWWSKMELYRPDIEGDILFFDLDTVIVGDLSAVASVGRTALLRDLIISNGVNSSVMYLTEADRAKVWDNWITDPTRHMRRCLTMGDQAIIGEVLHEHDRWQDILPGALRSYKTEIRQLGTVPADCSIVYFHGRPRPWKIKADWMPQAAQAQWSDLEAGLLDSTVISAAENATLHATIEALRFENLNLRGQIEALRASISWRITSPLRVFADNSRRLIRNRLLIRQTAQALRDRIASVVGGNHGREFH